MEHVDGLELEHAGHGGYESATIQSGDGQNTGMDQSGMQAALQQEQKDAQNQLEDKILDRSNALGQLSRRTYRFASTAIVFERTEKQKRLAQVEEYMRDIEMRFGDTIGTATKPLPPYTGNLETDLKTFKRILGSMRPDATYMKFLGVLRRGYTTQKPATAQS